MSIEILTLANEQQRLRLVPRLGGSVASWEWNTALDPFALFRPWDEQSEDRYTMACFPLVPWSNRITQGGFAHQGVHYAIPENRPGEPYPIHGDGWLQAWEVERQTPDSALLTLQSRHHGGDPYDYDAQQRFELLPDGLRITLKATHRGRAPLPYGLGLHPYFPCDEQTRLQATASGVWLSGPDPIPIAHTHAFPPGWDYNEPAPLTGGGLIDNCFTGWNGVMRVSYPGARLVLSMTMQENSGFSLMYRPENPRFFCYEPITHPIDAFHMKGRTGLVSLQNGESVTLEVLFQVERAEPGESL